jgi:hypothetical protein
MYTMTSKFLVNGKKSKFLVNGKNVEVFLNRDMKAIHEIIDKVTKIGKNIIF